MEVEAEVQAGLIEGQPDHAGEAEQEVEARVPTAVAELSRQ